MQLASERDLLGVGAWSASGIGGGTAFDAAVWSLFHTFRAGQCTR